jgi:hypothetical protein
MPSDEEVLPDSPSHDSRPSGSWVQSVCVGLACLSILSPLLVPVAAWHLAPTLTESLYAAYTGLDHSYLRQASQLRHPLTPEMLRFVERLYLERTLVETIVRTYNVLGAGFSLAAIAVALSLGIHRISRRIRGRRGHLLAFQCGGFTLLFFLACVLWGVPFAAFLTLLAGLLFTLNFPLVAMLEALSQHSARRCAVGLLLVSTTYLSHLLAPVAIFLLWAGSFFPSSRRARRAAIYGGRLVACGLGFPVLTLSFLSLEPEPLSPQTSQLIVATELYDVEIDTLGNRALVTTKRGGKAYAIDLDLRSPPVEFQVPTAELEDIALDVPRRRILHVDRATRDILVLDADTFLPRRGGNIPVPCSGSTKLALVQPANRLFVSWENDNFVVVNLETFQTEAVARTGNVNPLGDDVNGVVYVSHASSPWVEAIDARTLRTIARAPSARLGERLAISVKRQELYAPDALGAKVRVYSTPKLETLGEIPSQFGVRALAVDEERQWLLAGSAVTGHVDVIDLVTRKTIQHHYVGKYCRIIGVDPYRRQAFVTVTKEGLFLLRY